VDLEGVVGAGPPSVRYLAEAELRVPPERR
jgi:hypothetical protein